MDALVREETLFAASLEETWARFASLDALGDFIGYGPIPGIASARWLEGDGPAGSIREVTNTDGSHHREEVLAREPLRLLEDRLYGMTSPFRHLVREGRDTFEFSAEGPRTRLVRTVRFTLTSPLWWPVAIVALALFRRALRRHHEAVARRLSAR